MEEGRELKADVREVKLITLFINSKIWVEKKFIIAKSTVKSTNFICAASRSHLKTLNIMPCMT
jgi:hypothetical protein